METHRVHLKISGRVQGVYYRASALQEAQKLGLVGWVMNCADGSVETLAEGEKAKLDQFIAWCQRGPEGARITGIDIRWAAAEHDLHGFIIRRQ